MTTEREEFEKWYHQYIDNGYSTNSFEVNMFEAWQAATMAERERCALICEEIFDEKYMATRIRRGRGE